MVFWFLVKTNLIKTRHAISAGIRTCDFLLSMHVYHYQIIFLSPKRDYLTQQIRNCTNMVDRSPQSAFGRLQTESPITRL